MFQTWWDLNKQNIRKLTDTAMGIIAGYGIFQGQWGMLFIAVAGLALNYLWFWIDNRGKVTVKGLSEAGKAGAAAEVKAAIKSASPPK